MNAPRLLGIVVAALALGYLLVLVPDLGGDPFSGGGRFYTRSARPRCPISRAGLVLFFSVRGRARGETRDGRRRPGAGAGASASVSSSSG